MIATSFANKAELLVAVHAWCDDWTTAQQTYGPIGEWDVSRVTDFSHLFFLRG